MMTLLNNFNVEFLAACLDMLGEKEASISIGKQRFSISDEEGTSISTMANDGPIDITCSSSKMREMIEEKLSSHPKDTFEKLDKIIQGPISAWMSNAG